MPRQTPTRVAERFFAFSAGRMAPDPENVPATGLRVSGAIWALGKGPVVPTSTGKRSRLPFGEPDGKRAVQVLGHVAVHPRPPARQYRSGQDEGVYKGRGSHVPAAVVREMRDEGKAPAEAEALAVSRMSVRALNGRAEHQTRRVGGSG
jgi:hypothetical protein